MKKMTKFNVLTPLEFMSSVKKELVDVHIFYKFNNHLLLLAIIYPLYIMQCFIK